MELPSQKHTSHSRFRRSSGPLCGWGPPPPSTFADVAVKKHILSHFFLTIGASQLQNAALRWKLICNHYFPCYLMWEWQWFYYWNSAATEPVMRVTGICLCSINRNLPWIYLNLPWYNNRKCPATRPFQYQDFYSCYSVLQLFRECCPEPAPS